MYKQKRVGIQFNFLEQQKQHTETWKID